MPDKVDIAYMRALTEKLLHARLILNCITCDHFQPGLENCVLAQARPPARVIASGCIKWCDDSQFLGAEK